MNLGFLIALFIAWPILELAILMEVYEALGLIPALAIVVITGVVGASLAKMEGLRVIMNIQKDMSEGRMPAPHIIDGVMILASGLLLITPGLITDAIGFSLLVPPIRVLIRKWLAARIKRKFSEGAIEVKHWEC